MWLYFRLFLLALRLLRRDRRDLVLENLVLRQQLAVFERRGRRPVVVPADRLWCLLRHHNPPNHRFHGSFPQSLRGSLSLRH